MSDIEGNEFLTRAHAFEIRETLETHVEIIERGDTLLDAHPDEYMTLVRPEAGGFVEVAASTEGDRTQITVKRQSLSEEEFQQLEREAKQALDHYVMVGDLAFQGRGSYGARYEITY